MSTTLITDTIDDTSVDRDEHGWFARRTAKVLGVSGGASAIVYNAIQDALLTANNYNFGQAHPTMTALFCSKVSGKAIDTDKVAIVCEYRPFTMKYTASSAQVGLLTVGASVQSTQTNLDITGALMTVGTGVQGGAAGFTPVISGTANVDAAMIVLSIVRKESSVPSASVMAMINTYNQFAHTIGGSSYAAKTLKLDRINAAPIDNGSGANSYQVTYEFAYNPATWITTVVFQDSTGAVPTSAPTATYWNYNQSDFSSLLLW